MGRLDHRLELIPADIPVARVNIGGDGVQAALCGLAQVLYLVSCAAEAHGIDPGRPKVSTFGRKIYHLNAFSRSLPHDIVPSKRETVSIERKTGQHIARLASVGELTQWREAYRVLIRRLRSTSFGAVVLDYDGTLCTAERRELGPSEELIERL